jgi:hypothetical protein
MEDLMLTAPVLDIRNLLDLAVARAVSETAEETLHRRLARSNEKRLRPALGSDDWRADLAEERELKALEAEFVERERRGVAARAASAPHDPDGLIRWYEDLRETGPGQDDPLFPWLAETASLAEMRWFIVQEIGGEAGFEDLVALTQIRFSTTAKLELARNYWDEMGRGNRKGMHGPLLSRSGHGARRAGGGGYHGVGVAGLDQYDGGPGRQPPLCLPVDRRPGGHRDDGSGSRRPRHPGTATARGIAEG